MPTPPPVAPEEPTTEESTVETRPAKIKLSAKDIPLAQYSVEQFEDDFMEVVAAGWGKTQGGWGGQLPEIMQKVQLDVVDVEACRTAYTASNGPLAITESNICAGVEEGGKDTCQGDSGGPLMRIDEQTGKATVYGVTSWGRGCALKGKRRG